MGTALPSRHLIVSPTVERPPIFDLRTPPHCLKKNGTPCLRHSRRIEITLSFAKTLAGFKINKLRRRRVRTQLLRTTAVASAQKPTELCSVVHYTRQVLTTFASQNHMFVIHVALRCSVLIPLSHPNVAGALVHVEQHLVMAGGQIDYSLVGEGDPCVMGMKNRKRIS